MRKQTKWKQCSGGSKPLRQVTPPTTPPPQPPSFHASGSSAAWREAQICGAPTPSNIQQISISRGPWIPHQPSATTQHSSGGPPGTQSQNEVACRSTQTARTRGSCTPAGLQLTAADCSAAQRSSPPLLHCLPSISPSASLSPLAHPSPASPPPSLPLSIIRILSFISA